MDPILLVYEVTGKELLAYDDDSAGGRGSLATFQAKKGETVKVVVGARDGVTWGEYRLTLD